MDSGRIKNHWARGEKPILHAVSAFSRSSDVGGVPQGQPRVTRHPLCNLYRLFPSIITMVT